MEDYLIRTRYIVHRRQQMRLETANTALSVENAFATPEFCVLDLARATPKRRFQSFKRVFTIISSQRRYAQFRGVVKLQLRL